MRYSPQIHKTRVQLLPQVKAEAGTLYLILDRGKSAQHLSILTTFIVCYLLSVNKTSKAGSWIEVTETNQSMKDTKVLNPSTCLLSTNLPTVSRLPHALSACALVSSDQSDSHSQVPLYKMADSSFGHLVICSIVLAQIVTKSGPAHPYCFEVVPGLPISCYCEMIVNKQNPHFDTLWRKGLCSNPHQQQGHFITPNKWNGSAPRRQL